MSMKVIGLMVKVMDMDCLLTVKDTDMKDNGKKILNMAKEKKHFQQVFMKEDF